MSIEFLHQTLTEAVPSMEIASTITKKGSFVVLTGES
ncbi:hypothetical protein Pr1d_38470 [Bythopirellula goksoeyrii]|uniref:Uncharacterized protein n=1 Tax=Bythopirellula goksoeyrii TaxID=1400387 RepID=A0A5B9QRC8_9BACT|nr:hypothetical protein Pr1d_38470 [Bythopirellula goksoeyrii]